MLELRDVRVRYGTIEALRGVSIEAQSGKITCLLGGNGAGKTTSLRAISGLVPLVSGEILAYGEKLTRMAPHKIARMGIAHVQEGKRLFLDLSVSDNLLAGAFYRRDRAAVAKDLAAQFERFPILARKRKAAARTLSGGQQQMLALSRAVMARPRIYLLDEPSLGLAPLVVSEVAAEIQRIAESGALVVLVEQNARLGLRLADQAYVLETGKVVVHGEPAELASDNRLQDAYLGGT